jgi:hypothetical protein
MRTVSVFGFLLLSACSQPQNAGDRTQSMSQETVIDGVSEAGGGMEEFNPSLIEAARRLADAAEGPTSAHARLVVLADTYGPRLSGSEALERAIDWSLEVMGQDGLVAVHHSAADTLEKIDPRFLQRNAAAMALMAFILAER